MKKLKISKKFDYMMRLYYTNHEKVTKKLQKNYFYITFEKKWKKSLTIFRKR